MLKTREYTLCSPLRANAHNSSYLWNMMQPEILNRNKPTIQWFEIFSTYDPMVLTPFLQTLWPFYCRNLTSCHIWSQLPPNKVFFM